ncbi:hypothetical protein MTO96_000857 [Rhipicephalus appendiculatus]
MKSRTVEGTTIWKRTSIHAKGHLGGIRGTGESVMLQLKTSARNLCGKRLLHAERLNVEPRRLLFPATTFRSCTERLPQAEHQQACDVATEIYPHQSRPTMVPEYGQNEGCQVSDFYKDREVLITGGTGFIGKVLLEKLLRSCSGLRRVYLLVRSRRGEEPQARLKKMFNSVALVHVSTAYCNFDKPDIDEVINPPNENIRKFVENYAGNAVMGTKNECLFGHPNTYTLTKRIAESLLLEERGNIPVAIVRPSIVTAALSEPLPGWVDNYKSSTGIIALLGTGQLSSLKMDKKCLADIVPVDIVANTLICVAWHTSTARNPFCDIPLPNVAYYPKFVVTNSHLRHNINLYCLRYLPARAADLSLMLIGREPRFVQRYKNARKVMDVIQYFMTHGWLFRTNNLERLARDLSPKDKQASLDIENMCACAEKRAVQRTGTPGKTIEILPWLEKRVYLLVRSKRGEEPQARLKKMFNSESSLSGSCAGNSSTATKKECLFGHPNTYTLTKKVAESLLVDERGNVPVVIVRPSCVTAALSEPFPADLRKSVSLCQRHLQQYKMADMADAMQKAILRHPLPNTAYYPKFVVTNSNLWHNINLYCRRYVPARAADLGLMLIGREPRFVQRYKNARKIMDVGQYFLTHGWLFRTSNVERLACDLSPKG